MCGFSSQMMPCWLQKTGAVKSQCTVWTAGGREVLPFVLYLDGWSWLWCWDRSERDRRSSFPLVCNRPLSGLVLADRVTLDFSILNLS